MRHFVCIICSFVLVITTVFSMNPILIGAQEVYQTRQDVQEQYKWNLKKMYKDHDAWEEDLKESERLANELSAMSGKLGKSVKQLKKACHMYMTLNRTFEKAYTYATLSFHTDKNNDHFQQLSTTVNNIAVKINEKTSFFSSELLAIPSKRLKTFMKDPALKDYTRWIQAQLNHKEHVLPKEMEHVLAQSGVLAQAPISIFEMLTKDISYPSILDENGTEVTLNAASYSAFVKSDDRALRKRSYESYFQTMVQFQDTFAQVLSAEIEKNVFYSNVRKYSSSREGSLKTNKIPVSVYDHLIKSVGNHLPELHRYMELKKKLINVEEMHMYDLHAPYAGSEKQKNISFAEAEEHVKKGLAILGDDYQEMLQRAFSNRWIDVFHTPGKRGGAYQWGTYDTHPFILLNYQNSMNDVYTLAHELGHAGHTYFSNQKQSYLDASYPIFTAEVASITNEVLLFEEMKKEAQSKEEKVMILNQRLEDYVGTMFLQTMFAEFEQQVHEQVEIGEGLTAEKLNALYGSLLKKYFGSALTIDNMSKVGWSQIPHFYRNYYVYQYATGFAAANIFAKQIIEQGEPAVQRYIDLFLEAGNSDDPIRILKKAGIDMTSPKVVDQALKGFKETLDELEILVQNK